MKNTFLIMGLALGSVAFAQKKELKKADKAFEKNDYNDAIAEFNKIEPNMVEDKYKADYTFFKALSVLGNPNRPVAKGDDLMRVMTLLNQSEDMGFDNADQIVVLKRATSSAIFKDAQDDLKAGNTKPALSKINFLLTLDESNDKMRENAANLAYSSSDFESAKENYEILLDKDYTGIEESFLATRVDDGKVSSFSSMKAAEFGVTSGQYKDARIEKTNSQLGEIVSNLAWIYKNDKEDEKAKSLISKMQAKYPNDMSMKLVEADLYLLLGDQENYEKSVKSMDKEITDPSVYENLGIAAGEKENWDQAIDYYKKSIELKADNYVTQNNIAAAYINKGNLEKTTVEEQTEYYTMATKHLEKVVELKPDFDGAKQTLLGIYKFLDMTEKAEKLESSM